MHETGTSKEFLSFPKTGTTRNLNTLKIRVNSARMTTGK